MILYFFCYNHLDCFINNFDRISNFNNELDRIICVSASPKKSLEREEFLDFCNTHGIKNYRYLHRENFGLAEKGRLDYFSGAIGGKENFKSFYIFQMQDHYLDLKSDCSHWGKDLNYAIKGDVSPDNLIFDLDEIVDLFERHNLTTLYADRGKSMKYSVAKKWFICPNGGNFIFLSTLLSDLQKKFIELKKTCDGTYDWALFMEYFWGELFFLEGSRTYDYYNKLFYNDYNKTEELFKLGQEDYYCLRNRYLSARFFRNIHCIRSIKKYLLNFFL